MENKSGRFLVYATSILSRWILAEDMNVTLNKRLVQQLPTELSVVDIGRLSVMLSRSMSRLGMEVTWVQSVDEVRTLAHVRIAALLAGIGETIGMRILHAACCVSLSLLHTEDCDQ